MQQVKERALIGGGAGTEWNAEELRRLWMLAVVKGKQYDQEADILATDTGRTRRAIDAMYYERIMTIVDITSNVPTFVLADIIRRRLLTTEQQA